jgi:histidinol phosphatase-like PHP family hydrolase
MEYLRIQCAAAALFVAGTVAYGQAPVRQGLPMPDLPGFKTLKADFHLHTVFSDGNVWPTVHVQEAWRDGLDVIALTDHAEYHPHSGDVKVDGGRAYAVAKPLADQLGVILVPGVEITKPDPLKATLVLPEGSAHFNALFVTDANALSVADDLMEALRRAKAQEAFVFWNHPRYRVTRGRWFPPIARAFDAGLFQGMELVNGPDFYDEAYPWIAERQLTMLANSDAHDPIPPRAAGGRRPITLLFALTADLDGVREALVARRTAAWLGDDVWGAEAHLRGLWNGAVIVDTPTIARKPGVAPLIRLRNTSAVPMRIAVRDAPAWFVLTPPLALEAQAITVLRPGLTAEAPTGEHRVELRLEVSNLHVGPGRNLTVTIPLTVQIAR